MNLSPALVGAIAATLLIGAFVALQPAVNAELGRRTSDLAAAFVSVSLTFLLLAVVFAVFGDTGSLSKARDVPLVYLTGGIYGAIFVAVSLVTVRILGAGLTIALLISSQLIVASLLDHFGALNLEEIPLSPARLLGIAALLAGTVLFTLDA
jgi:bacterial/archaeal transporter family-2 protein